MATDDLKIKAFHVEDVIFGKKAAYRQGVLTIPEQIKYDQEIYQSVKLSIIKPHQRHLEINTIVDVVPVSTKVLGNLGYGITHTLTGVYLVLTGRCAEGEQYRAFGSSEGMLDEQMVFGKRGTPAEQDIIILLDIISKKEVAFTRQLMLKVFELSDLYLQQIREAMKTLSGRDATEIHVYPGLQEQAAERARKPYKVAIVKQVSGQGAMYDHLVFPKEPSGFVQGISIIDLNNMPVVLAPNEYRDGAIRAMD